MRLNVCVNERHHLGQYLQLLARAVCVCILPIRHGEKEEEKIKLICPMEHKIKYTRGAGASARCSRAAATPKALRRCQVVEMCEGEE